MKKILLLLAVFTATSSLMAQKETTKSDTIKVGNFIIIKKRTNKKDSSITNTKGEDVEIRRSTRRRNKNISTNWWIVDVGFANYKDETNYTTAPSAGYLKTFGTQTAINANSMKLNTSKSSNVNIWFFMQKINVYNHVLNFKYGLGSEMFNFRYDENLSFRRNGSTAYVYKDSVSFSKNKLYAGYLTMPFMLNVNATPHKKHGLSFSAGVSAGYLIKSRNKQISDARGKVRYSGNFDLEPFRLAAIGEIGLGPVRVYGSYSLTKLHDKTTQLMQTPYAIGFRLSNW